MLDNIHFYIKLPPIQVPRATLDRETLKDVRDMSARENRSEDYEDR